MKNIKICFKLFGRIRYIALYLHITTTTTTTTANIVVFKWLKQTIIKKNSKNGTKTPKPERLRG